MRYFWFVIFVLSIGSVSAQNSARVRELEKQRKAALAEIEMTSQLLDETRQTARNSLNRLNLLSKQIGQWNRICEIHTIDISLNAEQSKRLSALKEVHRQQSALAQKKEVKHRIVSIDRPYIRPVVRGK